MRSTTPVSHTACPMTSMPATIMSVSFPNPANAWSNPMMPNTAMAKAPNSAVAGSGKASVTNRTMTTANMMSATAACDTSEHRLSTLAEPFIPIPCKTLANEPEESPSWTEAHLLKNGRPGDHLSFPLYRVPREEPYVSICIVLS